MFIHKSTAAHTVQCHWSGYQDISNPWEHFHYSYSGSRSYQAGANVIDYEKGPQYIWIGSGRYCNWKECEHTRGVRITGGVRDFESSYYHERNRSFYQYVFHSVPWLLYSDYDKYTCPPPSDASGVIDELMDKLYDDIAGRAQSYLLSLEDVAGFFSGNSLVKSIGSVAQASNKLARAISICRRLGRRFGFRRSLYDCWTRSKELVQRIVGLRLGYRFSFKTTLNDIDEAVTWSSEYATYLRSIIHRNSHEYLRYEKTDTVTDTGTTEYDSAETNSRIMWSFPAPYAGTFTRYWNDSNSPSSSRTWIAGHKIMAFARAKVRYPTDYATFKHYFEGRAGLDKPLTTIWSIVPLSFVVDYLLNVQDSLTTLDNRLNDWLISTEIIQPWVGHSTFRRVNIKAGPYPLGGNYLATNPNYPWTTNVGNLSGTVEVQGDYKRRPIFGSSVSSRFPSLIGGENNWIQHVGTGLELLVSR